MTRNCSYQVDTNETENILQWMGYLGLMSTVVCITAAVLVFMFKLHVYFVYRLGLYQVGSAVLYDIALTLDEVILFPNDGINDAQNLWLCKTVGFFFLYFSWVKLLFTGWLVVHLFCLAVFYKNLQKDHKRYEKVCFMISILLPLLFSWIPFASGAYGPAGAWCWIQNWKDNCIDNISIAGVVEQFALWYGPAMVISVVESIAIIVIVLRLLCCYMPVEVTQNAQKRCKALSELLPLLAYPILFCVLLIPPLVNRIVEAASTGQQPNTAAIIASGISVPLRSFFSGLTLLTHVLVIKMCFGRTEYVQSTTYPDAWVFVNYGSSSHGSTNCEANVYHVNRGKVV